jgi:hypothetical protein
VESLLNVLHGVVPAHKGCAVVLESLDTHNATEHSYVRIYSQVPKEQCLPQSSEASVVWNCSSPIT